MSCLWVCFLRNWTTIFITVCLASSLLTLNGIQEETLFQVQNVYFWYSIIMNMIWLGSFNLHLLTSNWRKTISNHGHSSFCWAVTTYIPTKLYIAIWRHRIFLLTAKEYWKLLTLVWLVRGMKECGTWQQPSLRYTIDHLSFYLVAPITIPK